MMKEKIRMKRLVLINCALMIAAMTINAQQKDFAKLTDQCLGQSPPGMVPERFAESVITDNFYPHSKLIIVPNGKRIYWSTFLDTVNSDLALYYSDFDGQKLSMPIKDTVISKYGVYSFIFSADGQTIYFGSEQPCQEYGGQKIHGVWYCNKVNAHWSDPQPIKSTLDSAWASLGSLSMNNAGDLYFVGRYRNGSAKIYCSRFINGKYQKAELLPDIINTGITLDPYIDPQNRFLLFSATRRTDNLGKIDLYISFNNNNGGWSNPVILGENISTKSMDRFPVITPDGNYLFFVTSHGNHFPSTQTHYHWISTNVIEEARAKEQNIK